jgi:hypothetical protein
MSAETIIEPGLDTTNHNDSDYTCRYWWDKDDKRVYCEAKPDWIFSPPAEKIAHFDHQQMHDFANVLMCTMHKEYVLQNPQCRHFAQYFHRI